jgi:hypothetical protein
MTNLRLSSAGNSVSLLPRGDSGEGKGGGGRGLHPFPFQLILSSSVHCITQLNS